MPLRLVQHLIARGRLTEAQGQDVLHALSRPGTTVDTAVLESGLVPEPELLEALGEVSGLRPVNLADFEPNPQVSALLPRHIAERWCVTPLSVDGPVLHVACAYPVPRTELDEMGVLLGRPLELWIATELRVRDWIASVYTAPLSPRLWNLLARLDPGRSSIHPPPPPPGAGDPPSAAPPPAATRTTLVPTAAAVSAAPAEPLPIAASTLPSPPAAAETPTAAQTSAGPSPSQTHKAAAEPSAEPPSPTPAAPPASDASLEAGGSGARPAPLPAGKPRAAPWLPPSLQAAVERGEDISAQLAASPAAAKLAWSVPPRPAGTRAPRIAGGGAAGGVTSAGSSVASASRFAAPPASGAAVDGSSASSLTGNLASPDLEARGSAVTTSTPVPDAPASVEPPSLSAPATSSTEPLHLTASATSADLHAPQTSNDGLVSKVPGAVLPANVPHPGESFITLTPSPDAPEGARIPHQPAEEQSAASPTSTAEEVPDWTLAQARAVLRESARDRDKLLDVILRYARRTFEFAGVFAVLRGEAAGWRSRGGAAGDPDFHQVRIPLDAPSIFRTVSLTRGSYVGGLPADAFSAGYLATFGRPTPRAVLVVPVEVRSRLVALVYGDNGGRPISQRRLSDFLIFCQELPSAFQQLVQLRRQRDGVGLALGPEAATHASDSSAATEASPAGTPIPGSIEPQPRIATGWAAFDAGEQAPLGRAASLPPTLPMQEYVPSDFGPLLRRLTGPDAAGRLRAVAELARIPDASARALARAFPGPTAWSRMPVAELPEAEELGPIPGALARLGRAGAGALAPLLDSDDGDTRYLALLTAGSLPYPVLVDGILRGLFDLEPDISSAARASAAALKRVPRLDASMRGLRQELASRDPLRRSLAARALGAMHDREAIDGLIGLTGSQDEMCAQAAADALREITRASFGLAQRSWTMWWVENRGRRRSEWLVAALRHSELDLRVAAFEELARVLGDGLGYQPDAPSTEREPAVRRWEAALMDPLRGRRLASL